MKPSARRSAPMDAKAWAAWVAIGISFVGSLLSYIKSKDAKIKAQAASDRADDAIQIAARALAQFESHGKREDERDQVAEWERSAPARAQQLIDLAMQRGASARTVREAPTIGGAFHVTNGAERAALLHAAQREGVRLDPADAPIGGSVYVSVPNPHYRWYKPPSR